MKSINKVLTVILLLTISLIFAQDQKVLESKQVNIIWKGYKLTGEHSGNIFIKEGKLFFEEGILKGGEFLIDMNSITCTDIEDKEYNAKLVGHLKSDDFFGVKNYPTAKMVFSKVNRTKDGYTVEAQLTIKKATHPVRFSVVKKGEDLNAKIIVDRSKYDVRYGSSSFFDSLGDKVIYDDFELYVDVKL